MGVESKTKVESKKRKNPFAYYVVVDDKKDDEKENTPEQAKLRNLQESFVSAIRLHHLASDNFGHIIDRVDAVCPTALWNYTDELQIEVTHMTQSLLTELVGYLCTETKKTVKRIRVKLHKLKPIPQEVSTLPPS